MIDSVENRMVIGEYYKDDGMEDESVELWYEAFDRILLSALAEAMGMK